VLKLTSGQELGAVAAELAEHPAALVVVDPLYLAGAAPQVQLTGAAQPGQPLRAVPLTYDQFHYGFANAVSGEEAKQLYADFAVPASGKALWQAALANLNPWTEDKVDTKNPDRGPLLLISGELDHTVPPASVNASYKQQQNNPGVTEIEKFLGRGHALIIDSGWRDVADKALALSGASPSVVVWIPTGCRPPVRPPPRAGMPGAAPPLGSGTGFAGQRRS
jgi:non-heme chloroperoxidase